MRIAWVTPLSMRSSIGEFSRHVTAALAAHADVEIWAPDDGELQRCGVPVHPLRDAGAALAALAGADAAVYNIGNHWPFHGPIHELALRHPGVVILHDRVLHHMFVAKWLELGDAFTDTYAARMAAHYGEDAARLARERVATDSAAWTDDDAARHPLDVEALALARGAVTHSRGHAEALRSRWFGPVAALFHPSYAELLAAGAGPPPPPGGRVRLTTVGHVIPNKHVDAVISILAADDALAARVSYRVVGALDAGSRYVEGLERLVAANPHLDVELLGWRPEQELDRLMAASDVFVNLRDPVFESGSGSLARELAYGRPVLCFDAGSFGELPAQAVARVPAGDFGALAGELRALVGDPGLRLRIGTAGQRVASERGEADYARALVEFLEASRSAAPALALLDRVGGELGALDARPNLPVYETIASDFGRALRL